MTTNRTDSTKQQRKTAFCYAATWPKKHHVCGVDVALSQTAIRCSFFFPGKTELTPCFSGPAKPPRLPLERPVSALVEIIWSGKSSPWGYGAWSCGLRVTIS